MLEPLNHAMSNFIATHGSWLNSELLEDLYRYIFIEHSVLTGIMIVSFVSSVIGFGISVAIMTMYKKTYALDRATYFREIAIFLVLLRVVNGYFFEWTWPIFTATVYTMLFIGVVWYIFEIIRERGVSINWRKHEKGDARG